MSEVYLILYDKSNWNFIRHYLFIGQYFSAIEVYGKMHYFHPSGKIEHDENFTKEEFQTLPRERILMGHTRFSRIDVFRIIKDLSSAFNQNYNDLTNNCNHFSNRLSRQLLKISIPDWVLLSDDLTCLLQVI